MSRSPFTWKLNVKEVSFSLHLLWILPLFRMYFYHIIVLTFNTLHRIANIVYCMRTENIESVMCNGCWLMQNHKILTVDEVRCCQLASLITHSDSDSLICANELSTLSCFATHLIAKNESLAEENCCLESLVQFTLFGILAIILRVKCRE